ncbi:hypothetical protein J6590_018370 [Homalodisca vitripennis]|nr:hypothetical protein J6590_018370 [Homalodisca vitripennis]
MTHWFRITYSHNQSLQLPPEVDSQDQNHFLRIPRDSTSNFPSIITIRASGRMTHNSGTYPRRTPSAASPNQSYYAQTDASPKTSGLSHQLYHRPMTLISVHHTNPLCQQKLMCHLNLGNLIDVQERQITNRKYRNSGMQRGWFRAGFPFFRVHMTEINAQSSSSRILTGGGPTYNFTHPEYPITPEAAKRIPYY